ncbi:hypothetical protein ACHHV8_02345 [Paenibacillus sp. TAB 01]|uniref:hypothetical protein n=1 Tax=Paenibacillus sp. TAB 01 TaxID=3368988 RepID=UPI0037524951
MVFNVAQVARTYRSNALWHSNEEIWKRRGGLFLPPGTPSSEEKARSANVLPWTGSSPFDRFARESTYAIAAILQTAVQVKRAVRKLQSHTQASAVDRRIALSSDAAVVTASAAPGAAIRSYRIRIERAASAQYNEGTALPAQAVTTIAAGSNQMKLSCEGRSAPFSIYVVRTDTNRHVLQKIRAAIRQTGLPVEAALHEDAEADTVKLKVACSQTGSGRSFAIADVYGTAARSAGILAVTQPGTDALYRIDDGKTVRSESNRVTLDGGRLTLTLHRGSDTDVTVNVVPDEIEARQELQQLALRFNELSAAISQANRYLNTLRVHRVLEEAVHLGLETALRPLPEPEPLPLPELEPLSEPDLLSEEPPAEKPQPLTSSPWDGIGLRQYADGTVEVDEAALDLMLASRFDQWRSSLRADEGPTRVLVGALNRLLALPAEELLDRRKAAYQAFASYGFRPWGSLRTYLPLPLAGTLVNRQF